MKGKRKHVSSTNKLTQSLNSPIASNIPVLYTVAKFWKVNVHTGYVCTMAANIYQMVRAKCMAKCPVIYTVAKIWKFKVHTG